MKVIEENKYVSYFGTTPLEPTAGASGPTPTINLYERTEFALCYKLISTVRSICNQIATNTNEGHNGFQFDELYNAITYDVFELEQAVIHLPNYYELAQDYYDDLPF